MMETAQQKAVAKPRPVYSVAALGKLLAVGILLTPLAVMLFSEPKRGSGISPRGRKDVSAARSQAPERALIPMPFTRSDK